MMNPSEAERMGRVGFERMFQERERRIAMAAHDPIVYGWEPQMYEVIDALLDVIVWPQGSGEWEEKRDLNRRYRDKLRFDEPVTALLLNGGNQIGKTEYAIKRLLELALLEDETQAWAFHSSEKQSKEVGSHQHGFWRYMPRELKDAHGDQGIKTNTAYMRYTMKTGWSENSFILPNLSQIGFKFYGQDQDTAIQGPNIKRAWLDELFQLAWFKDLMFRVKKQHGWVLGTFTPVRGYTPACAWFYEGAEKVRESVAFMMPKDGGDADIARTLGFDSEEAYALSKVYGPNSIPENPRMWLEGKSGQPAVPEGRGFEMVPRVMKCVPIREGSRWVHNRAVVFLHSCDGPYGNPAGIVAAAQSLGRTEVSQRVYGYARKLAGALIRRFAEHHVCEPSVIPEGGTNYHIMDPAFGRNPFMLWIRFTGLDAWVYREWPGNYEIPGFGFLGPWVEPDEKHADGAKGPAQESLGWGVRDVKGEIARLEGWVDANSDLPLDEWMPENGAREFVFERYMDSRSASAPKQDKDRMTTLLTEFDDLGMTFLSAPADEVAAGVSVINDWLKWGPGDDVSLSEMRLHISSDCMNLVSCLRMWTGLEGQRGASKDPIDCLRYAALAQLDDAESGAGMETTLRRYG